MTNQQMSHLWPLVDPSASLKSFTFTSEESVRAFFLFLDIYLLLLRDCQRLLWLLKLCRVEFPKAESGTEELSTNHVWKDAFYACVSATSRAGFCFQVVCPFMKRVNSFTVSHSAQARKRRNKITVYFVFCDSVSHCLSFFLPCSGTTTSLRTFPSWPMVSWSSPYQ